MQAAGATWVNSSARISQIEDVRGVAAQSGGYWTYAFTYNTDSPPHLTSITNGISTGENYSFSYTAGQTLVSPFNPNDTRGVVALLNRATVSNIGTYHQ